MGKPSLAAIKSSVKVGQVYDLTNHYIERTGRTDHPCYGTRRVTVSEVNTSAFKYTEDAGGHGRIPWPKARQVERDDDGVIRMYGLGASQQPSDLFITLVPVDDDSERSNVVNLASRSPRQSDETSELAKCLADLRRSESLTYRLLTVFEPGQFDDGNLIGDDAQIILDTWASVGRGPRSAGYSISVNEYGHAEGAIITEAPFATVEELQDAVRRWCRVHLGREDVSFACADEA